MTRTAPILSGCITITGRCWPHKAGRKGSARAYSTRPHLPPLQAAGAQPVLAAVPEQAVEAEAVPGDGCRPGSCLLFVLFKVKSDYLRGFCRLARFGRVKSEHNLIYV